MLDALAVGRGVIPETQLASSLKLAWCAKSAPGVSVDFVIDSIDDDDDDDAAADDGDDRHVVFSDPHSTHS